MLAPFQSKRFEVLSRLGAGGMGVVYEAIDHERQGRVALKTIRDPQPETLLRFKNEFRALHDIRHPNLVSIGELHEEEGHWFFTMELIDGVDFLHWVRGSERRFDGLGLASRTFRMEAEVASAPTVVADSDAAKTRASSDSSGLPISPPVTVRPSIEPPIPSFRDNHAPPAFFDEERLRSALPQLCAGLEALHRAQRIHRDIKPSNLLVTRKGRVVLLDFGLVSNAHGSGSTDLEVVGTAEYMAPEQASAMHLGPEADWYSVGVLIFEVLTGRYPFSGASVQILMDKQLHDAPRARAFNPRIPADLDDLCAALLHREPKMRPRVDEVLARLAEAPHAGPSRRSVAIESVSTQRSSDVFVGRERELEALQEAAAEAFDRDHPTALAIVVEGESGVGKSALVKEAIRRIGSGDARTLVLEGRCYERETVTFKAFDGIVDALARHLRTLPNVEAAGFVPLNAALMLEAFPVLGIVEMLAKAPAPRNAVVDPAERRNRLFGAMRELFLRLRDHAPMVLSIDDLQWADGDSIALLQEIVRPPEGAPLLVVGTARPIGPSNEEATTSMRRRAQIQSILPDQRTIRLGRLSTSEARALARHLIATQGPLQAVDEAGAHAVDADAIVAEAAGHPMFIDALVRHSRHDTVATSSRLRLDDALWARVSSLEAPVRRLVEVVALTGAPVAQEIACAAAKVPIERIADVVRVAQELNLVKTAGPKLHDSIEPYHDRVRETVASRFEDAARVALHRAIAEALEAEGKEHVELLAAQWLGAGEQAAAVRYLLIAAKEAFGSLAIDHAAQLYRRALDLGVDDLAERRRVTIALGEAFAIAGRGAEAADAFSVARSLGVDRDTEFELSRRIAEQLLESGMFAEGRAALIEVLARLGIPYQRSPWVALVAALVRKLWTRIEGYRFVVRERSEVSTADAVRLDVLWTAVRGIMFIDFLRGFDFQSRYIRMVMKVGDRRHLANAFAAEASSSAVGGDAGLARSTELFRTLDRISEPIEEPAVHAHNWSHKSFRDFFAGDFRSARTHGERGLSMYAENCLGVNWYLVAMRRYLVCSYYQLGDFVTLQRRLKAWRTDAHRRGDLFAMANYSLGVGNASFLIDDDVEGARQDVEGTIARWPIDGFTSQHLQALIARVQIDLYEGRGDRAWANVEKSWRPLQRSLLAKARNLGCDVMHLRGRAALMAAIGAAPSERATLLRQARSCARFLERDGLLWSRGLSLSLRGAIASSAGDRDAALSMLEESAKVFESAAMSMYQAAAQHRLGDLRGDVVGREIRDGADRAMRAQGVAKPERLAAMMIPMTIAPSSATASS